MAVAIDPVLVRRATSQKIQFPTESGNWRRRSAARSWTRRGIEEEWEEVGASDDPLLDKYGTKTFFAIFAIKWRKGMELFSRGRLTTRPIVKHVFKTQNEEIPS